MTVKVHPSFAKPAGVWLKRNLIVPEEINIGELAKNLHTSRQTLSAILNGRAKLTSSLAVRLEYVLGTNANTLMNMQKIYDMNQARKSESSFKARRMIPKKKDSLTGVPA